MDKHQRSFKHAPPPASLARYALGPPLLSRLFLSGAFDRIILTLLLTV